MLAKLFAPKVDSNFREMKKIVLNWHELISLVLRTIGINSNI